MELCHLLNDTTAIQKHPLVTKELALNYIKVSFVCKARVLEPACQQGTIQSGGAFVMVWDVCSCRDMGPLIRLETTLIGDRYLSILSDHLHSFMPIVHSDGLGQYQQYNATPYSSRVATK
ncbi:hypothetical protein AVEN_203273-1 [Araneus ventricosus]|uniref:Uncharacterized protein n=1 Tax=Araneus ventricosus TaxID=182803 RepID=A0A4Y2I4W1_ARAVE|nr:hypothetical protein AVEN_203273-1 [Araneus ventricosus]